MSRSYRKNPIVTDGDSGKEGKKFASKKVRRYKDTIANGSMYRKIYESWNVHDYAFMRTQKEQLLDYESSLLAFLNGGSIVDPRKTKWQDYFYWYKTYKLK